MTTSPSEDGPKGNQPIYFQNPMVYWWAYRKSAIHRNAKEMDVRKAKIAFFHGMWTLVTEMKKASEAEPSDDIEMELQSFMERLEEMMTGL